MFLGPVSERIIISSVHPVELKHSKCDGFTETRIIASTQSERKTGASQSTTVHICVRRTEQSMNERRRSRWREPHRRAEVETVAVDVVRVTTNVWTAIRSPKIRGQPEVLVEVISRLGVPAQKIYPLNTKSVEVDVLETAERFKLRVLLPERITASEK